MGQPNSCAQFLLALAAATVAIGIGTAEAALPPGAATAINRKPCSEAANFAITGPLLLEQATEPEPEDDDPLNDNDGPDEPIALWLFGVAALILPATGIGAQLARHLPRRRTSGRLIAS